MTNKKVYWNPVCRNNPLLTMFTGVLSQSPPPRFSGVQRNSLSTYHRALLSERLEQATEDGAFALFFRLHPGGFDSSRVSTPGNLPSKAKKMLMPRGQPGRGGGWAQVELTDAL